MKKIVLVALFAISFFASARPIHREIPLPACDPCPFVR
jgi:hypothetical protein